MLSKGQNFSSIILNDHFWYKCKFALIFTFISVSYTAQGQNGVSLNQSLTNTSENIHDSIYYELVKFYSQSDISKSKHYALLSLQFSLKYGHVSRTAKAFRALGYLCDHSYQQDSALFFYRKGLRFALSYNLEERLIDLYNDIGRLHEYKDSYDSALHYFTLSYTIAKKNSAFKTQAIACGNIGLVYSYLENYPEALRYYNEALHLNESIGITDEVNFAHLNLARITCEQSHFYQALKHLQSVESSCKNGCNDEILADLYYAFGYLNLKSDKPVEARAYFNKSVDIARETGDIKRHANALFHLASLSANDGKTKEAIILLLQSEKLAKEIDHRRLIRDIYAHLSVLYEKKALPEKGLAYHKLYTQVKDSILNTHVVNNILGMQQKTSDAIIHEKETTIKEKESRLWKSHYLSGIVILCCVIAFALLYWIIRNTELSRKIKDGMARNMFKMIDERQTEKRELFRSVMELDEVKNQVSSFLQGPVARLASFPQSIDNATSIEECREGVDKLKWLCGSVQTVLNNMDELVLVKRQVLRPQKIYIDALVKEVNEVFRKENRMWLITIDIEESVQHPLETDKEILLSAILNAIHYFDHLHHEPVLELVIRQRGTPDIEGTTLISVKHHSVVMEDEIPESNKINVLTARVAAGKLKGSVSTIRCDGYTIIEISIPMVLTRLPISIKHLL